jgi:hypothetical protein
MIGQTRSERLSRAWGTYPGFDMCACTLYFVFSRMIGLKDKVQVRDIQEYEQIFEWLDHFFSFRL